MFIYSLTLGLAAHLIQVFGATCFTTGPDWNVPLRQTPVIIIIITLQTHTGQEFKAECGNTTRDEFFFHTVHDNCLLVKLVMLGNIFILFNKFCTTEQHRLRIKQQNDTNKSCQRSESALTVDAFKHCIMLPQITFCFLFSESDPVPHPAQSSSEQPVWKISIIRMKMRQLTAQFCFILLSLAVLTNARPKAGQSEQKTDRNKSSDHSMRQKQVTTQTSSDIQVVRVVSSYSFFTKVCSIMYFGRLQLKVDLIYASRQ